MERTPARDANTPPIKSTAMRNITPGVVSRNIRSTQRFQGLLGSGEHFLHSFARSPRAPPRRAGGNRAGKRHAIHLQIESTLPLPREPVSIRAPQNAVVVAFRIDASL